MYPSTAVELAETSVGVSVVVVEFVPTCNYRRDPVSHLTAAFQPLKYIIKGLNERVVELPATPDLIRVTRGYGAVTCTGGPEVLEIMRIMDTFLDDTGLPIPGSPALGTPHLVAPVQFRH